MIDVLRLRQAASHPFLLESLMKGKFTPEDIDWLKGELLKVQTRTPFVNQVGSWCEQQLQIRRPKPGSVELNHEGLATLDLIPKLARIQNQHRQAEMKDLCRRCGFVADNNSFLPGVLTFLFLSMIPPYIGNDS